MKYSKFEELPIWQEALKLTKFIYTLSNQGKWLRDFGLRDQIRRAAVSIVSNIVEGFERNNNNELIRYLKIAKGSAGEARGQLYVAAAVDYLSDDQFKELNMQIEELSAQIGGFIKYLQNQRKEGNFLIR